MTCKHEAADFTHPTTILLPPSAGRLEVPVPVDWALNANKCQLYWTVVSHQRLLYCFGVSAGSAIDVLRGVGGSGGEGEGDERLRVESWQIGVTNQPSSQSTIL